LFCIIPLRFTKGDCTLKMRKFWPERKHHLKSQFPPSKSTTPKGGGKFDSDSKRELDEKQNLISLHHTPIPLYLPIACDALNRA
jgi:hypothetical protein